MVYTTGTTSGWGAIRIAYSPVVEAPRLVGGDVPEWSTAHELELDPVNIHDGNTFYRALGFSWPYRGITRKDLFRAYCELDGPNSHWLTYVFKMLWDDEFRRDYNRMPFGRRFLDRYLWERFAAQAKAVAAAQGLVEDMDIYRVLQSWGVPTRQPGTESNEPVGDDDRPFGDSPQDREELSDGVATVRDAWLWGFYLWRSSCHDIERLARWQQELLAAFRGRGLRARLCVGFAGQAQRGWLVGRLGEQIVIFLRDDVEPGEELAAGAANDVMQMINRQSDHGRT